MAGITDELETLKTKEITLTSNKVANFAYTDTAYENDNADGVQTYDYAQEQNIPLATPSVMTTNPTVLTKGFRSQASSIPRMLMNHFFGRTSYNLNKVNDIVYALIDKILSFLGVANGIATLDENGHIPYEQLPESSMVYKGNWNASTNTPHLQNGTGTAGRFYICNVAGTANFGAGDIQFFENDRAIYDGSIWSRLSAGDVKSVNNITPVNGNVTITGADINMSSSDSTKLNTAIDSKIANQTFTLADKATLLKGFITGGDNMRFTASDQFLAFTIPLKDMPEVIKCNYSSNANYSVLRNICFYNSKGVRIAISGWQATTNGQNVTSDYSTIKASFPLTEYATFTFAFTSDGTTGGIVNVPEDATLSLVTTLPTFLAYNARIRKVIVDINGTGDYTSVVEAVEKEPENTPIYIKPGVYEGTVQAFAKRIILIGEDRNTCVLQSTNGNYNYPAINGSCGYLENLTLYSKYVQGVSAELDSNTVGAYAFHCENEYGVGRTLEFHHCKLMSDFFPALGMGMRKDFHCIIDDCILTSAQPYGRGKYSTDDGSLGALYFHDSVGANGNHYLEVYNSMFRTYLKNVVCPYNVNGSVNKVYARFINNVFYSETSGYEDNIWLRGGDVFNNPAIGWVLTGESCNNSNNYFNKSHPMKAGSKFFGEALKVINHTAGSSTIGFINSTKVLGFLGFNGNDLDSVARWNGNITEIAYMLDTLNFDKLNLVISGKTDANDCVQPFGVNFSGYGIACYYLPTTASNIPDSNHVWTIVTCKAPTGGDTVVITQRAFGQNNLNKVEYTRVGKYTISNNSYSWGAWDKNVSNETLKNILGSDANDCIPENGQSHTYFIPVNATNTPDTSFNWIIMSMNCNTGTPTTRICAQIAIGQNSTNAKQCFRIGYSTDSGSTWTWGSWKQVATTDQLGDQVNYSLSGNTLTITSK